MTSKEIRILAPVAIFFLVNFTFSFLNKRLISNALLFYLTATSFIIVGVYWLFREKDLSLSGRILWLIIILIFNFIGVISFVIWKSMDQKLTSH